MPNSEATNVGNGREAKDKKHNQSGEEPTKQFRPMAASRKDVRPLVFAVSRAKGVSVVRRINDAIGIVQRPQRAESSERRNIRKVLRKSSS